MWELLLLMCERGVCADGSQGTYALGCWEAGFMVACTSWSKYATRSQERGNIGRGSCARSGAVRRGRMCSFIGSRWMSDE